MKCSARIECREPSVKVFGNVVVVSCGAVVIELGFAEASDLALKILRLVLGEKHGNQDIDK